MQDEVPFDEGQYDDSYDAGSEDWEHCLDDLVRQLDLRPSFDEAVKTVMESRDERYQQSWRRAAMALLIALGAILAIAL